ncbi:tetraacyldisaccharide 4'-kinase [Algoriphagus halophytocola]|uniref:Tetraacyldisaccharide 4'-kinase n=1 Tax=Algoriphagus halophytocola TaxID=2991499 RepID=A0ABY6MNU9_9BACT|nr:MULTISPECIES: tetraacyldisaccharide 4'-kinase [unclassified Algoriphagus]UZD24067.1 tetraacyldisaccharide 4'-kinase [Algoriphagus sp. TR-M5]WBL41438.1 tetraacyldisaccharide 4'-kinase [Algoriphagus sp. TR-M9]
MRWYAFLLYPFSLIYDLITRVRNWCFNLGLLKSSPSPIPSLVVGNLSVGGTGKTPMVEFLIQMLLKEAEVAVLSRGYGRQTKGFLQATATSSPAQIGDEPFQVYKKFGKNVSIYVGEDRVSALEQIALKTNCPEVVILDDAFQHRYLNGDLKILLTTYQDPFYSDFLLPMGRLRESRGGAARADVIVVSKSPEDLEEEEKEIIRQKVSRYASGGVPVLFSTISYGQPFPLGRNHSFTERLLLLTGLANDTPLIAYVKKKFTLLEVMSYPDHHDYTMYDFEKIKDVFRQHEKENPVVLTTEKDAVKVKSNAPTGFLEEIPIFVLPIAVKFAPEDEQTIAQLIQQKVFQKTIAK